MILNQTFEDTPPLPTVKDSLKENLSQSYQTIKSVVNMDGTINTYPHFDNKKMFDRYKKLKQRAEVIKTILAGYQSKKESYLLEEYSANESRIDKKIIESKAQLKIVEDTLKRSFSHLGQKNTNKKGVSLNSKKKQKLRNVMSYKYSTKQNTKFEFTTFTVTSKRNLEKYDPLKDDELITKQLSKLLENLRKNYGLKSYIWVAERQTGKRNKTNKKTNAIHYHCVFEWYHNPIRVQILNLYWLTLLDKLGYQTTNTKYTESELKNMFGKSYNNRILQGYKSRSISKQMNIQGNTLIMQTPEFINQRDLKGNVKNPHLKCMLNPVDVKKINDLRGLKNYITKYITKNNQVMYSRVYAMSRDLSKLELKLDVTNTDNLLLDNLELFAWQKSFIVELTNKSFMYSKHIIKDETWLLPYYDTVYEYFKTQNKELLIYLN